MRPGPVPRPLKDRFYDKISHNPATGCMEWTASVDKRGGYGKIGSGGHDGEILKSHRVRYTLETGLEIPKGLCVCHRCDNPRCVTFAHLFIGTHRDNSRDKMQKGRGNVGVYVPDKVKERVVAAYKTGAFTQRELAEQAGVSRGTISRWVNGKKRALHSDEEETT